MGGIFPKGKNGLTFRSGWHQAVILESSLAVSMSLKLAKDCLQRKRFTEAIALLEAYCQGHPEPLSQDFLQAQMWLVTAWHRSGRPDQARVICESLTRSADLQTQDWANRYLVSLQKELGEFIPIVDAAPKSEAVVTAQANRYRRRNVVLTPKKTDRLFYVLSMIGTLVVFLSLILGFWLFWVSRFVLVISAGWWTVLGFLTVITSVLFFFMAPWLIDITQKRYQRVQWITWAELEFRSAEAVELVQFFCDVHNRDIPRLGWIDAPQPVIFCYGVLPNSVRIVVSRGLFEVLDDDEVAATIGNLLGRIANGSCFVLTFVSLPTQVFYLLHVVLERLSFRLKQGKSTRLKTLSARFAKWSSVFFHFLFDVSHYLLNGLMRRTTYLNDRYSAEVTGNPNALMRALPKVARGLVPGIPNQMNARILESTRSLGVYDYQTNSTIGVAFEILYSRQSDKNIYEVFLWELFNPWGSWLEFHSTHPLTAKRLERLTAYGKQLGLTPEYQFDKLLVKPLSKRQLRYQFGRDLIIQVSPWLAPLLGYILAEILNITLDLYSGWLTISLVLICFGLGLMFQGALRYPSYRRVRDTDLVSLLLDPYASAVRGEPVQVPGELLSYSPKDPLGYLLKLEDQGGIIIINALADPIEWYTDRGGVVQKLEQLAGESLIVAGWFRRFNYASLDLSTLRPLVGEGLFFRSYHQYWNNLTSTIVVVVGLCFLALSALL